MELSILIPAYNAGGKIRKCLDCLENQTEKNFEVVIIDDGSTDNTESVIAEYKSRLKNLVYMKQKNMGVSSTRQRLLENASGSFVMFCDSDDYFEYNAVETVMNLMELHDPDVLIFGYRLVRENTSKQVSRRTLPEGLYDNCVWANPHVNGLDDLYWSVLWNKCYRKSVFLNPKEIIFQKLIEDVTFNAEYLGRCKKVYICDQVLYNYVQIGDSLTRGVRKDSRKNIEEAFSAFVYLDAVLRQSYPILKENISEYTYLHLNSLCDRARQLGDKSCLKEIRSSKGYQKVKKEIGYRIVRIQMRRSYLKVRRAVAEAYHRWR